MMAPPRNRSSCSLRYSFGPQRLETEVQFPQSTCWLLRLSASALAVEITVGPQELIRIIERQAGEFDALLAAYTTLARRHVSVGLQHVSLHHRLRCSAPVHFASCRTWNTLKIIPSIRASRRQKSRVRICSTTSSLFYGIPNSAKNIICQRVL